MAPDWWEEAWEACEEAYAGKWESMSDAERDEAISDYMLDCADVRKIESETETDNIN